MTPIEWLLAMPKVSLMLGPVPIVAEVATTPTQQALGLMFRDSLPVNGGMLFVYPEERDLRFHMTNCSIPLDIIFIDSLLNIVSIERGIPMDTSSINGFGQYVLEVNGGLCAAYGIVPGMKVEA